jgi:hypothetical protein
MLEGQNVSQAVAITEWTTKELEKKQPETPSKSVLGEHLFFGYLGAVCLYKV